MKPVIEIILTEGPLQPAPKPDRHDDEIGASLVFEGIVRRGEAGKALESLRYEAYEPMTQNELQKLAISIVEKHQLMTLIVEHSVGRVRVGEVSFRLTIASSHRAEAIAACDAFILEMKKYVPLWKNPIFAK